MKGLVNGQVVELTEEQIKEFNFNFDKKDNPIPTDKDRLSALENAFAEFVLSLTGGDIQ